MSTLHASLADYLSMRRSLGYKLYRPEKLLGQFVDYLETLGTQQVTVENAVTWARLPEGASAIWWAARLSVVRGFARYLRTLDPAHEVPPPDVLPGGPQRATPYLYSKEDITALMAAADRLRIPLRAETYRTLIGLLAVTGIRAGEAIGLDRDDLFLDQGLLAVRAGKFGKSRELPLHPTTVVALRAYLRRRDQLFAAPTTPAVFISTAGTRLLYCSFHRTFQRLADLAGLQPRSASCRPRPHDLRHTFAVRTLLDWYGDGGDVQARLPRLSTYLGHVHPGATYWYLSAAPELLALASKRLEKSQGGET